MSVIYLTGVLDDGTTRDWAMPRDTAQAVEVTVGQSTELFVRVYYPSGVGVKIADLAGWSAELAVSCTVDPCQKIPDFHFSGALVVPDVLGNLIRFDVASGAFRGKPPGRYFFDVWLLQTGRRDQVVKLGAWHLRAGLVRP